MVNSTWTKDRLTEPGTYWWCPSGDNWLREFVNHSGPVTVLVFRDKTDQDRLKIMSLADPEVIPVEEQEGWFLGPLEVPELPLDVVVEDKS